MSLLFFLSLFLPCTADTVEPLADKPKAVKQPNIVLMVADDLGWADVPWHDALTRAPTLTALANNGIILDRHYVQPICSPTRSALMAGKYPSRLGLQSGTIDFGEPYGLNVNETIMAEYLKQLGYETHIVGKWHLGYCSYGMTPTKRGFDSFYGYYNGMETYYSKMVDHAFDFRHNTLVDGKVQDTILRDANNTYSAYQYAKQAVQVIDQHDKSKPLFLYYPVQNVHNPNQVPQSYYDMYEGIIIDHTRRTLAAMVTALDDAADAVVNALDKNGLLEETVFVFFSDNGGPLGNIGNGQVNYPLRGGKYSYWEGGVRSSSFLYSPLLKGGVVNNELLHVTDWLPTLTHIAACGVHGDVNCTGPALGDIDGVNQWQAITGVGPSARTEFLVNIDQNARNSAIRMGDWKLYQGNPGPGHWVPPPRLSPELYSASFLVNTTMESEEGEVLCDQYHGIGPDTVQLFDVVSDPAETHELSAQHPDIVARLQQRLEYYMSRAVPPANKPTDPASDPKLFDGVWTPWMDYC